MKQVPVSPMYFSYLLSLQLCAPKFKKKKKSMLTWGKPQSKYTS